MQREITGKDIRTRLEERNDNKRTKEAPKLRLNDQMEKNRLLAESCNARILSDNMQKTRVVIQFFDM